MCRQNKFLIRSLFFERCAHPVRLDSSPAANDVHPVWHQWLSGTYLISRDEFAFNTPLSAHSCFSVLHRTLFSLLRHVLHAIQIEAASAQFSKCVTRLSLSSHSFLFFFSWLLVPVALPLHPFTDAVQLFHIWKRMTHRLHRNAIPIVFLGRGFLADV